MSRSASNIKLSPYSKGNIYNLIKKGEFTILINLYIDNNDCENFRDVLFDIYNREPNLIYLKNKKGLMLIDYAIKRKCKNLCKLLMQIQSDNANISSNTAIRRQIITSHNAVEEKIIARNKNVVNVDFEQSAFTSTDIKHAIYSLLSLDTENCDSRTKANCIESGWSVLDYLPIHLELLNRFLIQNKNPALKTTIINMIQTVSNTLMFEALNDTNTAIQVARNLLQTKALFVTLRTGYIQLPTGHAIYTNFSFNGNAYEAKVCNLGDGIKHHEKPSGSPSSFAPTILYEFDKLDYAMDYFRDSFESRFESKREAFAKIYPNSFVQSVCENKCVVQFQQTTGNCVVKNLLLAMSQRLSDIGQAYKFDLIYQGILQEAIALYKKLGGNQLNLPLLENVCNAAQNKELSFLLPKDCAWIQSNLDLPQKKAKSAQVYPQASLLLSQRHLSNNVHSQSHQHMNINSSYHPIVNNRKW